LLGLTSETYTYALNLTRIQCPDLTLPCSHGRIIEKATRYAAQTEAVLYIAH